VQIACIKVVLPLPRNPVRQGDGCDGGLKSQAGSNPDAGLGSVPAPPVGSQLRTGAAYDCERVTSEVVYFRQFEIQFGRGGGVGHQKSAALFAGDMRVWCRTGFCAGVVWPSVTTEGGALKRHTRSSPAMRAAMPTSTAIPARVNRDSIDRFMCGRRWRHPGERIACSRLGMYHECDEGRHGAETGQCASSIASRPRAAAVMAFIGRGRRCSHRNAAQVGSCSICTPK